MKDLRDKISSKLKEYLPDIKVDDEVIPRVSFQKTTKKKQFPYIIYDLPNSFTNEEQEIFNLDVDIWDNKDDTTELETLVENIWRGLNRYRYIDENIQFSVYRESRLPPLDEEKSNIKRRKLIFQVRYFDRRIN